MRLLLLTVVLLGLLAGDMAASTGVGSLGVCDAANLAGEVATTCAAGVPTPACCKLLVASVSIGGGGDYCLCSVAHEMPVVHAGLNPSLLQALHSACGGSLAVVSACDGTKAVAVAPPSCSGGLHNTARSSPAPVPGGLNTARSSAATVPAPLDTARASPTAVSARPSAALGLPPAAAEATATTGVSSSDTRKYQVLTSASVATVCDSAGIGYQISRQCNAEGDLNAECCQGVVVAVDTKGCLCAVMNDTNMVSSSPLVAEDVLNMYKKCNGLRPLNGQTECLELTEEEDSPVPPGRSREDYSWAHADYSVDVTSLVLEALSFIGVVGYPVYRCFISHKKKKSAAKEQKMEIMMSRLHVGLRRELQRDVASLLDGLGGERPAHVRQMPSLTDEQQATEDEIKMEEADQLQRKNAKASTSVSKLV